MQRTTGRVFYYGLCSAQEERDFAALSDLYRPDAVKLDLGTGRVLQGREAIVADSEESARFQGPLQTQNVEYLVEYGDAVGAEAAVATRYETGQIYDLFVLASGAARIHVTGVISPRQAGTVPAPPGGTGTAAMRFYDQFSTAYHARDFAQVGAMCQPDVVVLLPSISGVLAGRDSTLAEFRKAARTAGRTRREAVVSYLEAPGVICVEDQTAMGTGLPGVWDHRLEYEVLITRGGLVQYVFAGLINPRQAQIQQINQERADQAHRMRQHILEMNIARMHARARRGL